MTTEKFNKPKKGGWHIEKRTRGKREHYERPGSAFRNVSGSGWWAVSVVRSPELPPSFRGPREERGVRGETGSPGPGFDWQRWTVFGQDGLERFGAARTQPVFCWQMMVKVMDVKAGSEAAESIHRWGHSAEMLSLWIVSNLIGQKSKSVTRLGIEIYIKWNHFQLLLTKGSIHCFKTSWVNHSWNIFKEVEHIRLDASNKIE